MRIIAGYVLPTFLLAVLASAEVQSVIAQDTSYPLQEYDDVESERDRVMYAPGEADPLLNNKSHYAASKDSTIARPARNNIKPHSETAKSSGKPASQEDDSILSFNFLYFIFEKYKLQDMVD